MLNKKIKNLFMASCLISLFMAGSVLGQSNNFPTQLGSTKVGQALHNDLNGEGKWNQITFADDTVQPSASGYCLQQFGNLTNPADSSAYYTGGAPVLGAQTVSTLQVIYIPRTGTLKKVYVRFFNTTTNGSAEESTISFLLNNTTATPISTIVKNNASLATFSNMAMSVPVTAGDFFELKWNTPAWVTNPVGVIISSTLYFE